MGASAGRLEATSEQTLISTASPYNRASSGSGLTVANGATLKIGGTQGFPANYTSPSLGASSTVEYSGANQTVANQSYGNLTLSGSGTKTMPAATLAIAGNFTTAGTPATTAQGAINVNGNVVLNGGTFNAGSFTHTVKGNWTNGGGTFNAGTGKVTFNGSSLQTVTGGPTFNNLEVNGGGLSLAERQPDPWSVRCPHADERSRDDRYQHGRRQQHRQRRRDRCELDQLRQRHPHACAAYRQR